MDVFATELSCLCYLGSSYSNISSDYLPSALSLVAFPINHVRYAISHLARIST